MDLLADAASSRESSPYSSPAHSPAAAAWSSGAEDDDSAVDVDDVIDRGHGHSPKAQAKRPAHGYDYYGGGVAPAAPPMNRQYLDAKKAEFMAWYETMAAQLRGAAASQQQQYGHSAVPPHATGAAPAPWHPAHHQHHSYHYPHHTHHPQYYQHGHPHHHNEHHHTQPHSGYPAPAQEAQEADYPATSTPTPTPAPAPAATRKVSKPRSQAGAGATKAKAKAKKEKKLKKGLPAAGGRRPAESYAQLAANAISATPGQRASVKQIYQWVETAHPFYKQQGAPWWKNCIRHNLSMKSCFLRHPNAGGMGVHLWTIDPNATPEDFAPARSRRRTAAAAPVATKSSKATTKRAKTTSNLGIIRMVGASALTPPPAPASPGGMMSLLAAAAGATSAVAVM